MLTEQQCWPLPHVIGPEGHTHTRPLQNPLPHAWPQAPQLLLLVLRSTHAPLHTTCEAGQLQAPPLHVAPVAHADPHAPQLAGSVCLFVQIGMQ